VLRQLQTEGLLEPAEGRGLRVISLTDAELVELYQVRE
jgi:DNA-binding GntR family transcriptional regulator